MIIEAPEKIDILNVKCIFTFKGKYLLVHQKKEDKWEIVNGHFEDEDRSINLAIKNKISEKIGILIEPSFVRVFYHKVKDKSVACYLFKHNFISDPTDQIKLNGEFDKFGFFEYNEALKLKLIEDEDYFLESYIKEFNEN